MCSRVIVIITVSQVPLDLISSRHVNTAFVVLFVELKFAHSQRATDIHSYSVV